MGFSKGKLDKVITIKVNHGQFPDTDFVFKFKRTLDEQAAKEQAAWLLATS